MDWGPVQNAQLCLDNQCYVVAGKHLYSVKLYYLWFSSKWSSLVCFYKNIHTFIVSYTAKRARNIQC